jgi:hypothetical protein
MIDCHQFVRKETMSLRPNQSLIIVIVVELLGLIVGEKP